MTLTGMKKSGSGGGWTYNQPDIKYSTNTDGTPPRDTEGRPIKYNQVGTTTTLTAQAKHTA